MTADFDSLLVMLTVNKVLFILSTKPIMISVCCPLIRAPLSPVKQPIL